jgi:circadian clock protein KaiB
MTELYDESHRMKEREDNGKEEIKITGRSDRVKFRFRLYVSGTAKRSMNAVNQITEICKNHLGDCDLQIIDIYENPGAAKKDDIIAIPTLIKLSTAPRRRIIGDLADTNKVLNALESY